MDFHPVSSRPIHVDFLRIGEHTKVHVAVPVRFDNEEASPGLKRGGVLNVVHPRARDRLRRGAASRARSTFRSTGLEIGDSIHISQVKLPDGVTPANTEDDFTVATIVAPSAMKAEEEEAAAAEGESRPSRARKAKGEAGEGEGGRRRRRSLSLPLPWNQEPLALSRRRAVSFCARSC